ncbi:MAG: hypothetical protein ABI818_10310 [Acidobacteriota bacterium]
MSMSFSEFARRKKVTPQAIGAAADRGRLFASVVTASKGRRRIGNVALADEEWAVRSSGPTRTPAESGVLVLKPEQLSVSAWPDAVDGGVVLVALFKDDASEPYFSFVLGPDAVLALGERLIATIGWEKTQ